MAKQLCCVVLCSLALASVSSFDISFGDVTEVLKFSREVVTDVLESYHMIKPKRPGDDDTDFPFVKRMEKRLMNHITQVSRKIDVFEGRLEHRTEIVLDAILTKVPEREMLESSMHDLWKYLGQIDNLYQNFLHYASAPQRYEQYTMEDFAKNAVSSSLNALPDVLKMIHRLVVPPNWDVDIFHRSILTLLAKNMQEASTQICNTQQSPQQLLYNLYNKIALTEIKGYTMMQFSWTLLKLYNIGNFTEEMEQLKQQYAIRTSETLRAVKTAMVFAPREVWKCDPIKHKLDVTYTELKQVFQGYLVNEVDMNPQSTCKENCAYYSYSKVHGCYQNQFCSTQRRCNGKLINCQYIDSDMWVCPSDKSSTRRYEYIEYENGQTFGQKGTCKRPTTKVDSWWRWLFWHCSYCMCTCDDHNSSSDRYFNLRDVTSDVDNNKVVTGVRLKKENQIIHIQIQEGTLLPRGNIDGSSVAWKKIDNYTIIDANVRAGVDYHTIMWEKRAVDLDDLDSPADHLLTGLRFRVIGTHLNLEIQMTPFNFTTGQLIKEKSLWHSHDTTEASEVYDLNGETQQAKKRTELKLNKPDIPTRSVAQAVPDSQTNQYLLFVPTDLGKDAAQSTVPFIDTQSVEPKPPVPISGAGIFHKGRDGFGGFLSLKLITYNFEPQLHSDLPPAPPAIGLSNDVNTM
ncbi:uncharacterized protein LOC100679659 isoform X1 [Nasonia vitripennis]|uniref:Uncharacterized protein n=1 Tax=Nasonia vitripennis TaxID=7425 RepID=A0A7M7GG30_NASVI|nr:uncharacterized protein LOC100679659 isoform X1 [Nasonia vitripennis]XP_032456669.1 uncharacterized protein LOC100679659 isoform X1 [Nasonia vitripennis]